MIELGTRVIDEEGDVGVVANVKRMDNGELWAFVVYESSQGTYTHKLPVTELKPCV